MLLHERKLIVINAIRRLEDKLCSLRYCEYDGEQSPAERTTQIEELQKHLHCAHSVLVLLNEEEMKEAS